MTSAPHSRTDRASAFAQARELLYGIEVDHDDLIVVADWLLTGSVDAMLRAIATTARAYSSRPDVLSPDAAYWSPGLDDHDPVPHLSELGLDPHPTSKDTS